MFDIGKWFVVNGDGGGRGVSMVQVGGAPPSFWDWLSGLRPWMRAGGCPRGVMVKAMNCGIIVREFVLQSRYYVHFRANTLGKGMNPLILPPAMDK